jgi:microcystin-dependent protein
MFSGSYAPRGWALCDGGTLNIADNSALFALLGNTYGGDGVSTFALPDLCGRAPLHQGPGYPRGQKAGTETVALTTASLAAHSHTAMAQSANGTASSPSGAVWAGNSDYELYATTAPDAQFNPAAIAPAGAGLAHDNMMPFTTVNFIIATAGIYPQPD